MAEIFNAGDKVRVSGDVKWGDDIYRVETDGIIEEWGAGKQALITLEYVAGDVGVCIFVDKNDIAPLELDSLGVI